MKNTTTQEAADQASAAYRAKCKLRRNGHLVEELQENGWTLVTIPGNKRHETDGPGVNRAKRYVRQSGRTSYNV